MGLLNVSWFKIYKGRRYDKKTFLKTRFRFNVHFSKT